MYPFFIRAEKCFLPAPFSPVSTVKFSNKKIVFSVS